MKIWAKIMKNNHLVKDTVVEDYSDDTRTHKILRALDEACHTLDLSRPIWLKVNENDFKRRAKTRFRKDNFMEPVDFDYLEFHVIEED